MPYFLNTINGLRLNNKSNHSLLNIKNNIDVVQINEYTVLFK